MAFLFADEDFSLPAVAALRARGHDVLTTLEAGLAGVGTNDAEILAEATRLGRTVLTMNRRDYIALHATDPNHAGIVVCKHDADTDALAARIDAALAAVPALAGHLFRVNRPNIPRPRVS